MKPRAVALARGVLVFAGLAPFLPPLADALGAAPLGTAMDAWFRLQCERDPARMLGFGAVCARCLGLYLGLGLGALLTRPRLGGWKLELWLGLAALAMLADVGSEWLAWRPAWALLRLGTGLALGYPAGVAVVRGLRAWAEAQNPSAKPSEG